MYTYIHSIYIHRRSIYMDNGVSMYAANACSKRMKSMYDDVKRYRMCSLTIECVLLLQVHAANVCSKCMMM